MSDQNPPPAELKFMQPYLQRSTELKDRDPVVAYYCTLYALKQGIALRTKSKDSNSFLGDVMDQLEGLKKSLINNEAISNEVVGSAHVEAFALKVFLNADNEDRSGSASKKTAKTFLAASIFLDVLNVFGEIESEIQEKIRYSKWKASDIMKAIKEGRTPTPGAPGEEIKSPEAPPAPMIVNNNPPASQEEEDPFGFGGPTTKPPQFQTPIQSDLSALNFQNQPIFPIQAQPSAPLTYQSPYNVSTIIASAPPHAPTFPVQPVQRLPELSKHTTLIEQTQTPDVDPFAVDHKSIQNAQKFAKFAISSLQYEDIPSAVLNLQKALVALKALPK